MNIYISSLDLGHQSPRHGPWRRKLCSFMIFSILKRLPLCSPPIVKLMASSTSLNGGSLSFVSQRLLALAQQLRHYKPPPCSLDDSEEQIIEEAAGKVDSQVGFQESVTPVAQNPEKFRPKRAAVLICLFEGDAGDLRVILTKRSSRMSIHSGQFDSLLFC